MGPVAGAEFGHGAVDVGLDGERADLEAAGYLVVGEAARDVDEDLAFAAGEGGQPLLARPGPLVGAVAGLGEEGGDEALGGGRGEQGLAGVGDADGAEQFGGLGALAEETGGSRRAGRGPRTRRPRRWSA